MDDFRFLSLVLFWTNVFSAAITLISLMVLDYPRKRVPVTVGFDVFSFVTCATVALVAAFFLWGKS